MFYVGHFWWVGPEPEYKAYPQDTGWFTCLAEADSAEAATEKFRELVEGLGSWYSGFGKVREVFLASIVEVKRLPDGAVLAHFETYDGDGGTVAPGLPGVPGEFCASYELRPEDEGDGWAAFDAFVSFDG